LPIDIRLTAVPAPGGAPLAQSLAAASDAGNGAEDLAVPVQDAQRAGLDSLFNAPVADVLAACEAGSEAGDVTQTVTGRPGGACRILFLGIGDGSPAHLRRAGAALARRVGAGRTVLTSAAWGRPEEEVRAFAEGLMLGSYRFSLASSGGNGREPGHVRMLLSGADGQPRPLEQAIAAGRAVALARDLANTPSACKSPSWLAGEALRIATVAGLDARVFEAPELAARGFGGLLAVGSGSARPPALIELGYRPPGWREHVVLVGKGITFDSGGLSLKPPDAMLPMKTDMAGGAVVIAVMSALARFGVGVRVTGLVPAAENMPSGSALHPGDVITHFGGRTTEVLNTDAEGRLVLADALAYAGAVHQPDAMVDIATLTGAARVALGTSVAALYANRDGLARDMLGAAAGSGEQLWRMPLVEDYVAALESPVADMAHVPHGAREAGSIHAALFLREFTGGRPWAHLDVAGAARSKVDEGELSRGATGYGVRLLLRWLAGFARPSPA
jgi:leucyl aminopeptidase